MNWDREITINCGVMYDGSRWLGSFSSHQAALEGLQLKRKQLRPAKCRALTEGDLDILESIDFDEV